MVHYAEDMALQMVVVMMDSLAVKLVLDMEFVVAVVVQVVRKWATEYKVYLDVDDDDHFVVQTN